MGVTLRPCPFENRGLGLFSVDQQAAGLIEFQFLPLGAQGVQFRLWRFKAVEWSEPSCDLRQCFSDTSPRLAGDGPCHLTKPAGPS